MESLSICVRLCEQGINPEALSAVIKELRKASESLKVGKPPEEPLCGLEAWVLLSSVNLHVYSPPEY